MPISVLDRAKRSFSRKRYYDVISLLEPEVINYRDSFIFYYLLGLSCLYTGDIGGAGSYFQRARQIKMRDPDLLAAQAALYLRRGNIQQAVDYYLEILEYAPKHKLAKKALQFLRLKADEDTISDLVSTGKIARFYPCLRFGVPKIVPVILASVMVLVLGILQFALPSAAKAVKGAPRADLTSFELNPEERENLVETGGTARYILTAKEIETSWTKARALFQSWRDNAAQVEVNRLLSSNASSPVKQKARLLMTWFKAPGFDNLKDNYDYSAVMADPVLYLDCWVIWKGMAANLEQTPQGISFDFLVGYDTRNRLEGIISAVFEGHVAVDTDTPLEVLGRLVPENGRTVLNVLAIHQTGKPVQK